MRATSQPAPPSLCLPQMSFLKALRRTLCHCSFLRVLLAQRATPTVTNSRMTSSGQKRSRSHVKLAFSPPEQWEDTLNKIRTMRKEKLAPVDTMGCDKCQDDSVDEKTRRFQVLVSLMLSSQTKDEVTYAAMERLKADDGDLNVQKMVGMEETKLAEMIKPVGFYKRKAGYIKRTSQMLLDEFEGDVPKTIEDLLKLPGVGNKMGYLCLANAWGINDGIGVDTHVHRITGRLGWTSGSDSVEKTREELEGWLPKEIWQEVNHLLVGFGQTICSPVGPKCSDCLCSDTCPSAFKKKAPTPKKK